jgi:glycine cleavage system aminomethyltransferase T
VVTAAGQEIGVLTSPATSPLLGNLGLAILRTEAAADGNEVQVAAAGGGTIDGTVDVLAIYDPKKEKPRS